MDSRKDKQDLLKEIFPGIHNNDINKYLEIGYSIDEIACLILESPPAVKLSLDECLKNFRTSKNKLSNKIVRSSVERDFNYPEIFRSSCFIDTKINPFKLREKACDLYTKSKQCFKKMTKDTSSYYVEESDIYIEQAKKLNREASVLIIRKMMDSNRPGTIDLHNLFVEEAIMFLSDYIRVYKSSFKIITGRSGNSIRLMPAVKNFLERKKFYFKEEGPFVHVLGLNYNGITYFK